MCGIAGIFHSDHTRPVDVAQLERMRDAMAHRGPDGAGVWTAPGIGLGHRRLSIIDLAGSAQPMTSHDGRATIVFNGEIYNYRELRAELATKGAQFHTQGDTEVILAAWQAWGVECLPRLHGMFAFALYDHEARTLLLARDRLGVKPLYMAELHDGTILFASELKGLLAHPSLPRNIDPLAVEDYLAWGYVPDHRSFLQGVTKLPAGHYRLLNHGGAPSQPRQWWDLSFANRRQGSAEDLSAELLELMRDAVKSRMVADVPLGAFLSGGVDSSAVVALMAETGSGPVRSCTIGFDEAALDETAYATEIARKFGTIHASRMVGFDDFAEIGALASMFDEPFADASALPTWRACQLARENVSVALSGDGADEVFAGYRRQKFHAREEAARALIPGFIRKNMLGPLGNIYPKADWAPRVLRAKTTLLSLASNGEEGYARALAIMPPELRAQLYSADFLRLRADYRAEQPLVALMRDAPARTGLDRTQYADCKFWLPGDILVKTDRTSMAAGLEAREPLLDHRLVEFGASLPDDMRLRGGEGKWLLKKAMEPYLPHHILYRPKQGFVTPISAWLRGPLSGAARAIATSAPLARTGWFDAQALSRLAEDHIAGRADHGRTLWQMLMLDQAIGRLNLA